MMIETSSSITLPVKPQQHTIIIIIIIINIIIIYYYYQQQQQQQHVSNVLITVLHSRINPTSN